jgi:hypothetical protein
MMTCLELALTAQLICLSDETPVCTDNGSVAQLLGLPACTSTEPIHPGDARRRTQGWVNPHGPVRLDVPLQPLARADEVGE